MEHPIKNKPEGGNVLAHVESEADDQAAFESYCLVADEMAKKETTAQIIPFVRNRPAPTPSSAESRKAAQNDPRVKQVMAWMVQLQPLLKEWRAKLPIGKEETVECPICHGRLHLSQAACNGHVHGNCETVGCVRWME